MKFIRKEKGITLILLIVVVAILFSIITLITNIVFSSKTIGKTDFEEENLIRKVYKIFP